MKVYVSKYALTDGVYVEEVRELHDGYVTGEHFHVYKLGLNAHLTREEAVEAAEQRRLREIEKCKEKIRELEKIEIV